MECSTLRANFGKISTYFPRKFNISLLECASFVGTGEIATKEAFEWITSFPKICDVIAMGSSS
ncbi:hypothetical protein C4D60_Mb00t07680 [Musa balbisiana]|uniref:Uncharacterized protein n=1 Tax=Musa balbisiana TaxID=52838 RepID=A0A4S8I8D3_MUSBA|nr:hypothetical protein C4D60_Mb00t07680 [Musa balbisiana]